MDLVEYLGKTYGMKQNNIIDIIHGKNDSLGLLNKVAGLQAEKLRSDSYNTQWNYWYAGGITKDGRAKIITLNEEIQYFTNWIEKSFSFIPISKYFSLNV